MKTTIILLLSLFLQVTLVAQSSYNKIKVSDDVKLIKLSNNAYIHISVTDIGSFKNVSSNGLILVEDGEAFLFDTPVAETQTQSLVAFISDSLQAKVTTFIPNHWHIDCMGGLDYLHSQGAKSYANEMTIETAKKEKLPQPLHGFTDSLSLKLHDTEVKCYYLGAGHSLDNVVVWIPAEKILFPGCMVKDMTSKGLGNTADADVEEWPKTIRKLLDKFPDAQIIIPGHGEAGSKEIIYHTLTLLTN